MERRVAVDTPVGIIWGRDAIYLDGVLFDNGRVTLVGELNGPLCSRPSTDDKWVPYRLTFMPQIWMQTPIDLHDATGYASSIDEVEDSAWLEEVRSRRAGYYITPDYKHYVVSTYDDIFDFIATGFDLEVGTPQNIELREPTDADWNAIARVANEALPHAADGNAEWLSNRRAFGNTGRTRRHYVAVDSNGVIVAYAAVEEDPGGRFRLFAVMGAHHLSGATGDLVFERLHRDLLELGAQRAWMREQADDLPIIAFATAHGFHETRRFAHERTEIVEMELPLAT